MAENTQTQQKAGTVKNAPLLWATGRRKTAVARLWVRNGTGKIVINKKDIDGYFAGNTWCKIKVLEPVKLVPETSGYDFFVNVSGGGLTGQAEAIRHAMSRALSKINETWRPKLKAAGFLRRDPRMVERKKPGQPKARKKFQWTKR
ncbi:MAG: 30S ribosomal protein S9 [Elusimicrobiota bacterium]